LAHLHDQALIDAFVITAATLRVNETVLLHVFGTLWRAVRVDLPITDLFVMAVEEARLTENNLIVSQIAEMIRRAVVGVRKEACLIDRTLDGPVDFLAQLGCPLVLVLHALRIVLAEP